jgi:iron complex outermembrane receptor protein
MRCDRRNLSSFRRAALLALACWAGPAFAATSPEPEFEFDLPAGPLAATLLRIAERSGTIVSFQPELVEQRTAPAIQGRFTLLQALTLAAQPSGLAVDFTPGGSATVLEPTPQPASPIAPPAAAKAAGAPPSEPAAAALLPRVEILGSRRQADGLRALRSWSATRSDTPLSELSQAVSVLTADALALQGGNSVLEAAPFVPGAGVGLVASGGVENFGLTGVSLPSMMVRGLPAPYALSGLRSVGSALPPDNRSSSASRCPRAPAACWMPLPTSRAAAAWSTWC